jgi:glycosyltransferase involved in cell wall biosynthesis
MAGPTIISVYNRYLNRGGEDEVFESEAQLLTDHGWNVKLVTDRIRFPDSLREKIGLAFNATWSRRWYAKFQALLKQCKPDIVHVHNTFPVISPSIYYACQRAGIPVVQTLHNYRLLCPAVNFFRDGKVCEECVEHSLWRGVRYGCFHHSRSQTATVALSLAVHRWARTWTGMVDRYIALSEFARQKFIAGGLPAERISVKPNFVHPDPGTGDGTRECALFVGRLSDYKGLKTLLAAWHRLGRIPLVIIGDGPLRGELEAEASRRGLSNVRFQGRLKREQVFAAIQVARFLLLPTECYETFGMTIAEAFACGTPVICSRLGAMQEIVADGRTGLHFTPGQPEDLSEKVQWAWTHPERMAQMGNDARREYEAKYTGKRNYAMLMEIYDRMMHYRDSGRDKPRFLTGEGPITPTPHGESAPAGRVCGTGATARTTF